MATSKESHSVKSLNTAPGRRNRHFVFKSFSQKIEEIEIDVYRNFDPIKAEPFSGSSFLLDCLIQWRELNTAEDFISFFEEMMPLVQTLPLVLLHKELIISKLVSRLQMKARLSMEPILRLIAELSKDLLEDFLPFLPRIVESLLDLLRDGAAREPEIIEQIFTSWSYIMMYLQKYLTRDIIYVLKVTIKLRYYTKDFVREFMAEALSFLLRNAPNDQLIKGIRKVILEAARKPSEVRKSGVSALLWHVMRGTASKFHSRAIQVLRLLIDNSTLSIDDKFTQGLTTVVEVVILTFQRACVELKVKELELMWDCLCGEAADAVKNGCLQHLSRLLSLLISTVPVDHGRKVNDYKPLLELVGMLVKAFITPSIWKEEEQSYEVTNKILQLMLCILDGLYCVNDLLAIANVASLWSPAFQLRSPCLRNFLKELLQRDPCILKPFQNYILSAVASLIETSPQDVLDLTLTFCERLQLKTERSHVLNDIPDETVSKISHFLQETLCYWIRELNDHKLKDPSCGRFDDAQIALLWGSICCYPYFFDNQGNESLLMNLVDMLDQLLVVESVEIAGLPKQAWLSLIGAALNSYHNINSRKIGNEIKHTRTLLQLAKRYKSSVQILTAVADYLESTYGSAFQTNTSHVIRHPDLEVEKLEDAHIFSENLFEPDKDIRVPTLKILCHYETLTSESSRSDRPVEQQIETEIPKENNADDRCFNVLQLLLSIEETPISVATSRKLTLLVSRIQTALSAARVSEPYVPFVFYGIIGIMHNQFMDLSNSASECLAVMLDKYSALLWDLFIGIFEHCHLIFVRTHGQDINVSMESTVDSNDLVDRFRLFYNTQSSSRSRAFILSLLLRTLQKIPAVVEVHSRQIIPLFLKFMGYHDENPASVGSFDSKICEGRDWKVVLVDWLSLLKLMKNPRSFYRSHFLKEVLVNRLLDENDAEIQLKVLDCLLKWKDGFLLPYEKHLKNLISSKTLREELTTWNLSRESNSIEEEHRAELVHIVIRLMIPKVRSLKTLASRKHASVNNRKAVLGFIGQLSVDELPLFFVLLIKSLQLKQTCTYGADSWFWGSAKNDAGNFQASGFVSLFSLENLLSLHSKKRYGFLHLVEDILGVFDEFHVRPFLDLLMGCVVRILESCAVSLHLTRNLESTRLKVCSAASISIPEKDEAAESQISLSMKQLKDMRSLCLKIISVVFNKYEDHDFGSAFWDLFFKSVKPLIDGFKQEGSSSEKPSSLFSCFLAMSQSHNLVLLLGREENLVSQIFAILSVPTASDAVLSCVLKFIENLLTLELEAGHEKGGVNQVLCPNLEALVDNLHHLFYCNRERKRKFLKHPGESVLRVFNLLAKFIKDPYGARKFVDILLPLVTDAKKDSDSCAQTLLILREVVPILGSEATSRILNAVSPLLVFAGLEMRLSVCDLFDALAQSDSAILSMTKFLRELNATSVMEMAELDFDAIISAYDKISMEYFYSVTEDEALVILSHCIYDMSSEELILRHSAYRSLLSFVEFSAVVVGDMRNQGIPEGMMAIDSRWTAERIQQIVNKFLLKQTGDAMSKEASIRKEWIDLLHEMVLKLSDLPNLRALKVLCSEDAEVDFFNNIVHLQKHRRARALARFKNIAGTGELSEFILKKIFIPLFFSMLFDVREGQDEHLRSTCLDALACISGQMGWKSYYALLMRCFRDITKKHERQKVLLRLVCSVIDHFHFSETHAEPVTGSSPHAMISARRGSSWTITEIQLCLTKTVLPKLQKLLESDSGKVNVNISVAILKVLKLLPGDIMDSQLPSIIHRIANFLKSRLESIRDEARSALAACLKELGVEFLQFIVSVLRATLKRGFELHVLGYTLNFILSNGLLDLGSGKLDYCLDELLNVLENDILGDVAEEKDVEKIASKMKETRKRMSFETLKLIAEKVTFKTHALKLLSPVTAHLHKHFTPKTKLKLETMLNHIAAGIERNPSVNQNDLFIFTYGLIDDGIKSTTEKIVEQSGNDQSNKVRERSHTAAAGPQCSYLVTVFALGLFHNRMKSIKIDKRDDALLLMLDPFVKLLTDCLNSKYEEVVSAALKCVFNLVTLPLPSLDSQAENIKATLLDIAESSSNSSGPLMQSCLKLLSVLLRSSKVTLATDQLHVLIQFPLFVDLEKNPSFVALSLLKAIVRRRLVVPEIYDVVTQISELMVTSQVEPIRKKCGQILLQFLLNYQLSKKRQQQHLDFLVANLRYEHASGREAVLEMLKTIIKRFPESIINEQSQTLFVHLVVSLANDHDNHVRSLIGIVIKNLISRISPQSLHSILEYSLTWYLGEKQHLWITAAQALGFIVEVIKKGLQKHISSVLPVLRRILQCAVSVLNDGQLNLLDQTTIPYWKEAYYSLVLWEKILMRTPELFFDGQVEDIWLAISELLMHPHPWLCNISNRLLALYFEQTSKQGKALGTTRLTRPSRLFVIATSQCYQIKAQLPDNGSRKIVKCNVAFAVCGIHALTSQQEFKDPIAFWSSLDPCEQSRFMKACQVLGAKTSRIIATSFTCGLDNQIEKDDNKGVCYMLVSGLLKTMGKIALLTEDIQTKIVLGSFKLIASQISPDNCQQYAFELLLPVYKLCEGFSGKIVSDDVKQHAEKVRQSIQEIVGIQNFVQAYSQIRSSLKAKRDKRRQEEKLMAVVNPTRNAKRKLRIAAKHKANKKRKIVAMKMTRWMR